VPAGVQASASAVSIPRDSFVRIGGGLGRHKVNSAYGRGMGQARRRRVRRGPGAGTARLPLPTTPPLDPAATSAPTTAAERPITAATVPCVD